METPSNVFVFETPEQLAFAAAERFVEFVHEVHGELSRFSVALAGGRTPKRVYELLATERFKKRIDWSQVHFFFGDERCVPPTHPDSNYAMVYETLISRVAIPAKNVRRLIGEGDAVENAGVYENQLRTFFAPRAWPRFDLVLLGMGTDGHTASLFPKTRALNEKQNWVVANSVEKLATARLTLTAPAINHAQNILFLVTGAAKAKIVNEVLRGPKDPWRLPAQLIDPVNGNCDWLIDKAAASEWEKHK